MSQAACDRSRIALSRKGASQAGLMSRLLSAKHQILDRQEDR